MIYYYSGTGNTRYAARQLAATLGDRLHFIPAKGEIPLPEEGESIGFMFPIYSWGVPPIVLSFLERLDPSALRGRYLWSLCTCGDETGIAMRLFSRKVSKMRGSKPDALFSLIMPNDYVLLPGFDVDPPEVAERKLEAAPARLREIAARIGERQSAVFDVHEGSMPALRTRLVYPLFKRWGVNPKRWRADETCVSCGKCARVCPVGNITMRQGRPEWGTNCLSCCGCYNACPSRAIHYATFTRGKGQYFCPLD